MYYVYNEHSLRQAVLLCILALVDLWVAFVFTVANLQLLRFTSPMNACLCTQGGAYACVDCVIRSASIHNVHTQLHGSTHRACAKHWLSSYCQRWPALSPPLTICLTLISLARLANFHVGDR
jgi:hypothetical protein